MRRLRMEAWIEIKSFIFNRSVVIVASVWRRGLKSSQNSFAWVHNTVASVWRRGLKYDVDVTTGNANGSPPYGGVD